jgi:ABC-2 type transport system ATP-binding protein
VGLSQAVLGDPAVIILDEPMVGLDPKQIIEIRDLIRSLAEEHTVILSSHILSEISAICDHVMIISKGKLIASDSPEGLQKLMGNTVCLNLEVKGEWAQIQSALESVAGMDSVEYDGEKEPGVAKVRILAAENTDIREEVFFALAGARLAILAMQQTEQSLEDIFLELTGNAAAELNEEDETKDEAEQEAADASEKEEN